MQYLETIRVGVIKTQENLRRELRNLRVELPPFDLNQISLEKKEEEVDLWVSSARKLTGHKRPKFQDVFTAVSHLGDLCTFEDAIGLRVKYRNQPRGERIRIAMNPFKDFHGDSYILVVRRTENGLFLLESLLADGEHICDGTSKFAFRLQPRHNDR